jgi:hypothetical protein
MSASAVESGKPVRYRFISPYAGVPGLVAVAAAARVSLLLGVGIAFILAALLVVLLNIGCDLTTRGVLICKLTERYDVAWSDVGGIDVIHHRSTGQRIVLMLDNGTRVTLPAPTSKSRGFVDGLGRIRAAVAQARPTS